LELKAPSAKLQVKTSWEKILIIISAFVFLLIMHVFVPNIGGVLAKQVDYVIWFLCGLITLVSTLKVLNSRRFFESPLNLYVFLFVGLWFISIIFNPIKNMANFFYYSFWLIGSIVFWIGLLQFELTKRQRHTLLFCLYASSVIEAMIGISQFYGLYRYIPITPSPEEGLVGGIFQQKNVFSSWLATGLVVSLYLVSTARFRSLGKIMRITFFVTLFLVALALVLGSSRAGFIGVAVAGLLLIFSRKRQCASSKMLLGSWVLVFSLGIFLGFTLVSFLAEMDVKALAKTRAQWFADYTQESPKGRLLMYATVYEMFKDKPIWGHGFSNFGSVYMYYEGEVKKTNPFFKGFKIGYTHHPHSEVLLIVAESGVLGIIGLLILCYGVFRVLRKLGFQRSGTYLALLFPILFHSLVEFPLRISTAHWFTFILLFSFSTSHFTKVTQLNLSKGWVAVLGSLACSVFLVFSIFLGKTFVDYNRYVIWYIEYNEYKKADFINLEPATQNIYLKNFARPMYMFAKAEQAILDVEKHKEFLLEFLKWSEGEKARLPTPQIFLYDALALLSMGVHYKEHVYFDEAMKSVEQGLFIYPGNEDLIELGKRIVAEAVKALNLIPKQQAS